MINIIITIRPAATKITKISLYTYSPDQPIIIGLKSGEIALGIQMKLMKMPASKIQQYTARILKKICCAISTFYQINVS